MPSQGLSSSEMQSFNAFGPYDHLQHTFQYPSYGPWALLGDATSTTETATPNVAPSSAQSSPDTRSQSRKRRRPDAPHPKADERSQGIACNSPSTSGERVTMESFIQAIMDGVRTLESKGITVTNLVISAGDEKLSATFGIKESTELKS